MRPSLCWLTSSGESQFQRSGGAFQGGWCEGEVVGVVVSKYVGFGIEGIGFAIDVPDRDISVSYVAFGLSLAIER